MRDQMLMPFLAAPPRLYMGGEVSGSSPSRLQVDVIRLKHIYNFLCSMLILHQLLCVLFTLRSIFMYFYAFSGTNLLTRCHSVSSCFLLFLYFRKVIQEIFSKLDETKAKVPIYLKGRWSPEGDGARPEGSRTIGWRRPPPSRATRWCGPLVHPLTSLLRL
jgi:hypothetical protein